MPVRHPSQVSPDWASDIVKAQEIFRRKIANKSISYDSTVRLIRRFRSELGNARRRFPNDFRYLRMMELILLFAVEFHKQNIKKYESYRQGSVGETIR